MSSEVLAIVSLARTDAAGRYRLENVPPGRYLISAGPLDSPTYYPGVFSPAEATIVNVTAGRTGASVDLTLPASVRGRIRAPGRDRLSGATVTLADISIGAVFQTRTNTEGAFRFDAVRPGSYSVTVDDQVLSQPAAVSVRNQDIIGLELTLLDVVKIASDCEGLRVVLAPGRISFEAPAKLCGTPFGILEKLSAPGPPLLQPPVLPVTPPPPVAAER
jgi:hypothetical protein